MNRGLRHKIRLSTSEDSPPRFQTGVELRSSTGLNLLVYKNSTLKPVKVGDLLHDYEILSLGESKDGRKYAHITRIGTVRVIKIEELTDLSMAVDLEVVEPVPEAEDHGQV